MMLRKLTLAFALFFPALPSFVRAQTPPAAATSAPQMHSAYGERLRIAGIPNAGKINEFLYRGSQPKEQGFGELKKLGISTVVDLRGEGPDKIAWERRQTEALGMHFVNIPVSGFSPPTNDQVAQFLSLFAAGSREKVFVHCRFGDDRTGVFVAVYRMALEKWPSEQAMKEMYFFGFKGFWHPAMRAFIRDFPARFHSASVFAPFQTTP